MDWLATVDVPAMTLSQAVDKEKDGSVIADVLMALKDYKVRVLFRNELYGLMQGIGCKRLLYALSQMDFVQYSDSEKARYIKSVPDLMAGVDVNEERLEIRYQLFNFHTENSQTSKVYLISRYRPNCAALETVLDKKPERHHLTYFQSCRDVVSFMSDNRPKLVQKKHHGTTYVLGGEKVAPFSAYDAQNESAAIALLMQAFDEYQEAIMPNSPPDTLFTRDLRNRTYVRFNHSGNWEYHGYDVPVNDPRLPNYIKSKYNIWK